WQEDLTDHIGSTVSIVSAGTDPLYVVFEWEGIPVEGPTAPEARNPRRDHQRPFR
ncbi:MAG: hypothetical protein HGA79_04455, partial [Anaerolineales bacterium]|nr:hypothetical protein [Anaerolineales bacterium]